MARIEPLSGPYSDEVKASFAKLGVPGVQPLALFRTLAHNPRVLRRIQRGGLLDPGSISVRLRELVILRTCALCGAQYEWAVHIALFGAEAGWIPSELATLANPTVGAAADGGAWSEEERVALDLTDSLHRHSRVDEVTWRRAAACFSPAQLIELVTLAGLYHAVSYLVNALGVEPETWAPT